MSGSATERGARRSPRRDGGFSLIEVIIALSVMGFGAMGVILIIGHASVTDEVVQEETIALRAALTVMEEVRSLDYDGDIGLFIAHWSDPANTEFEVPELNSSQGGNDHATGTVEIDGTDPDRVAVTVTITWEARLGRRSLSLPMTITETER